VKPAIWLVNSRAGSGYPARGLKCLRGILKMSLFHCSSFIKQLLMEFCFIKGIPNGFPCMITWSMHLGCCSTFGKRKNTFAFGSSIFTLSESLATSLVHGSRNHARKTIRYSFNKTYRTWKYSSNWVNLSQFWRLFYFYLLSTETIMCWWRCNLIKDLISSRLTSF
jgi:hypothetical protein